ncbi:MAG: patatin [Frankiales bacterium]|nr:patatin [Frankiales bacterium]
MIAFVLGGGGMLGAVEVGMLRALVEADIQPDLILGSSVGAINGAAAAASFDADTVGQLAQMWERLGHGSVFSEGLAGRVATLARTRTHVHGNSGLRSLLEEHADGRLIEGLEVPFGCVAACIETASAHWFESGPVADAVLASCAVPGLLPPVAIGGRHYVDGGLVHSIPVGRAIARGATQVFVLQVGRVERPLSPPRWPWDVATVAFEIARRHRFSEEMAALPEGLDVTVLPSGDVSAPLANLRYRSTSLVAARIETAYQACTDFLAARSRS